MINHNVDMNKTKIQLFSLDSVEIMWILCFVGKKTKTKVI